MSPKKLLSLITVAVIFITVLFWVQTLYSFWQSFTLPSYNQEQPYILLSFTLILTLLAAAFYYVSLSQSKFKLTSRQPRYSDEIIDLGDESIFLGFP